MKFILFAYLQEHDILQRTYHRWTRANTPDSASFRCFSPWWALTHLHLKKHSKTHRWPVLCSFVGAEICSAKESPSTILAVWSRGPAVWANFCPSKPRLPSFIGGKKQVGQPLPGNLGSKNNLKEDPVMFLDWMLAGSFVLDLVAALAVRASVR